jgi:hypothetical protein
MIQDELIGVNVVPASPTSSEDRLNSFLDVIHNKPTSPLLAAPTRPTVLSAPSVAPKRSCSRLANNKLAKIPITHHGEVLLMGRFDMEASDLNEVLLTRRFDMEASDLNGAFSSGLSGGLIDKVLDTFPSRKASASEARGQWRMEA